MVNGTLAAFKKDFASGKVRRLHDRMIRDWHSKERRIVSWEDACARLPLPKDRLFALCSAICRINTFQWHEEDKARDTEATDRIIAAIKRSIDKSNQRRVNAIEELDLFLESMLHSRGRSSPPSAPLNSETPGSLVDRLSIVLLKLYHMTEQRSLAKAAEKRRKLSEKVRVLKEQAADLGGCLDDLTGDVLKGSRRFKTYFQFKMYNDPDTNPYMKKSWDA